MILLGLLLGACASVDVPPDRLDGPPADFALAVTVFGPEFDEADIADLPRPFRPARYIVEPNRELRASIGPGSDAETYPPLTRRLERRQMAQLWRLVRDAGLLDPSHPGLIDTTSTFRAPANRRVTTVYAAYGDTRRYLQLYTDRDDASGAAGIALADRLAELAWVRE